MDHANAIKPDTRHGGCRREINGVPEKPAKLFCSYMDNILRSIEKEDIQQLIENANALHPKLSVAIEYEAENSIPFLNMRLK